MKLFITVRYSLTEENFFNIGFYCEKKIAAFDEMRIHSRVTTRRFPEFTLSVPSGKGTFKLLILTCQSEFKSSLMLNH